MKSSAITTSSLPFRFVPTPTTLPDQRPRRHRRPRIVAIGGGTGLPVVLRGLREATVENSPTEQMNGSDHLTALVTVTDDGGSSGRLRQELGILPPGDIRNCLAALAAGSSPMTELLQHRFVGESGLKGHAVGNIMLAALAQMTGDFVTAIEKVSEILTLHGRVLPSTRESITLRAEFEGGDVVEGETAIAAIRRPIRRLWLDRQVRPLPEALQALINADAIVVGPGSLYTSILPNLLVGGVAATISGVNAVRIYVANLMTEPGETDGFTLDDHLNVIREHVGHDLFDYVLVNRRPIDPSGVAAYRAAGCSPVCYTIPIPAAGHARVVARDLASEIHGGKIRHAPADLARAILELTSLAVPED